MLFLALGALLLYSLATFGAVQPHSWLLVSIGVAAALVAYLVKAAILQDRWYYSAFVVFCLAVLATSATRSGFFPALVAGLLAWIATAESRKHLVRFLRVLVVVGVAEALLGLTQYFISPGWIFGYVNTAYRVSGTLINHNHFAGLLEMLIPVAVCFAYIGTMRFGDLARSYVYLLAGAVMGVALFFSGSRMGIISFFATVFFLGIVLRLQRSRRSFATGFTLTLLGLVISAALWIGVDVVLQHYSELFGEEAISREGRVLVFRDAIRMIAANPLGVGIGNFQDRFREYQTYRPDLIFDHTHNDYLETAAEWGIPAAVLFWTFIGLVFIRSVRLFVSMHSPEQSGILLACIGAMFSILIHSLADFNLQIPSNAMLFFSFAGISLAMPMRSER
jgi:hypothetical protein